MKVSKVLNKKVLFNHNVNKLTLNSKEVEYNDIFFAFKGSKVDGNKYIEEAINKGAKTIVTEDSSVLLKGVNVVIVEDVSKYLGECCKRFYKDISKKVKICAVTGTNGKSSTATLVYKYLRSKNINATLISTYGIFINDKYIDTTNTTPNIIKIYNILKESIKKKVKYVIMEVSSHAVKLNRIYGLDFYIGSLTNITHDHLDFHKTLEDYKLSKILFLSKVKYPILNYDYNEYVPYMNSNVITFGENEKSTFRISEIQESYDRLSFKLYVNSIPKTFKTKLLSKFNAYNIALFIAIIYKLGLYKYKDVFDFLKTDINIPGRMEVINESPKIVVDFAHTPDAIKKVLEFFNKNKKERIITVIGMGGDRDKSKRRVVGFITNELSDYTFYTSDNSRSEKTIDIINDIIKGCSNEEKYEVIEDRKEAIKKAIEIANNDDIILILGRGAETKLETGNDIIEFDDKTVCLEILNLCI